MKNRLIKVLLIFLFSLNTLGLSFAEEFIFEISDLEIIENGNIYKGNNRGKITTNTKIEIISNNFEYLKKINRLEANGDVRLTDIKNDITINAEKVFYLKDEEKIYTVGKTRIKISEKYNIEGFDLILLKNKMILSSNKSSVISDNFSNIYKIDKFEYLINEEILKGEKIEVTTNNNARDSDTYFFETGFINLKEDKFLAKDVNVKLHKSLFGNNKNDPRINSISGYGDKLNTYFDKGVFTSCKKTDKCPPWKISAKKIHHDKNKEMVIYKDAWLEVYDFPIIYYPVFFHPSPNVKRQSGFLKPELGSSQNLGNSVYTPYFFVISDNKDITIKPKFYNEKKILLQNEFRQITKNSSTIADFSITTGHDSSVNDKNDTRSHFFSNTKINLDLEKYTTSMLEINFEKTSNDNYLKLFNLESPLLDENNDVLESIIKLDLEHENYDLTTSFEMYETLDGKNSNRYQYVLPSYNFSKNFNLKDIDGSFNLQSSGNNSLRSSNVLTSLINNSLNYTSINKFFNNGIKSNYEVLIKNINTMGKNSAKYKTSPQSELMSAYIFNSSFPLQKNSEKSINTFEPKFSFRFSPHEMKNNKDTSRRMEVATLFTSDRLGLGDSFEGGESVTAGLNFRKQKISIKDEIKTIEDFIEFKLAKVFRIEEEINIPKDSTLGNKDSNIFGELNYNPVSYMSLGYNFAIHKNMKNLPYNAIVANFNYNSFSTRFNFLEQKNNLTSANFIENTTSYTFNEENSLSFKTRKNRDIDLTEYYNLIYEYKNDCLVASVQYNKNYYNDVDIKPVEELFFSVTIVPLITFSPDKMALR